MQELIRKLVAARLAADVLDVPTVLVARTDSDGAQFLTSDIDGRVKPFVTGERTSRPRPKRISAGNSRRRRYRIDLQDGWHGPAPHAEE
jgi:isocitrate lyase